MNKYKVFSKIWFLVLLLVAFVAGCAENGAEIPSGPAVPPSVTIVPGASCSVNSGPTIPTVTSSKPTSGNQLVAISTAGVANSGKLITATFSLAMDPATLNSATPGALSTFTLKETASGANVAGTVAMDTTNKVATFTTSAALIPETNYTAGITTAAMSSGATPTAIACSYEWEFKTTTLAVAEQPSIDLGTADTYGIIATNAITSSDVKSHVYGDVALTVGVASSVTGVNLNDGGTAPHLTSTGVTTSDGVTPGEVNTSDNGNLSIAQLAQLQADLNAAYNDLSTRTPTTIFPAGIVELSGEVLSPGIYAVGTASDTYALSSDFGPLVLDAAGDPDAIFIFQAEAITTTTGSVVLQGGAQAKNVFWVLTSNATIGSVSTFFQGTIVAGNTITVGLDTNVQGRMLAGALGAGSITNSGVITVPK